MVPEFHMYRECACRELSVSVPRAHQYSLLYIESVFSDNWFITLVSVTVIDNPEQIQRPTTDITVLHTTRIGSTRKKTRKGDGHKFIIGSNKRQTGVPAPVVRTRFGAVTVFSTCGGLDRGDRGRRDRFWVGARVGWVIEPANRHGGARGSVR